jgi:DNA-binding phage protein
MDDEMEEETEQDAEQEQENDSPFHAEAIHLMELIRFLARTLGFNNAKLARRARVPLATLVRYFKGEGEPKVEFLLSMVHTLGLDIREFFELAYPAPEAPSASRLKIDRILQQFQPGRVAQPPAPPKQESPAYVTREEMERMLGDLRRDMRELMAAGPKEEAPAPEPARRGKTKKAG